MIHASRSLGALIPYTARSLPIQTARTIKNRDLLTKIGSVCPNLSTPLTSVAPLNTNRLSYGTPPRRFFYDYDRRGCFDIPLQLLSSQQAEKPMGLSPKIYDLLKGPLSREETEFYRSLILKGNILVIGCKTGRLLLPLSEQPGTTVDGVDPSSRMIDECASKVLQSNIPVSLHQGSIEDFCTPRKYHTIIVPEETFASILDYNKALAALESVRNHLKPTGKLIIELLVPATGLKRQPILNQTYSVTREKGNHLKVSSTTSRNWSDRTKLRVEQQRIEVIRDGKAEEPHTTLSHYRIYSIQEFLNLLNDAGFKDIEILDPITQPHGALKIVFQAIAPDQYKVNPGKNF